MAASLKKSFPEWLIITSNQQEQRLDNFLLNYLKGLPRSHIYRLIRKGEVRINKKRAKPEQRLQAGDNIRIPPVYLPEKSAKFKPKEADAAALEKCILYEDNNLLVLNKPSKIAVHGGSGVSFGVIELLRYIRPQAHFLELAHRLDRETSGCLILAKKSSILKELHELLRLGKVEKTYLALVIGHWDKKKRHIDAPLIKNQLTSGERMVKVDNQSGKAAWTEFQVKRYYKNYSLLEVTLHTGRTHQIRVHAAYAEHPIIGDEKYGNKAANKLACCSRLFLHASQVAFTLASSGQTILVNALLPPELQAFLAKLD